MLDSLSGSNQQFLASINLLQQRIDAGQQQISSGSRIQKASDAPNQLGDLFQTRTDLARVTQVDSNLSQVKGEVDTADSSIQSAIQLLDQVRSLGAQGATGSATASSRTTLANQVQQLLQQLVGISRTEVNGSYIFSGDDAKSPSYEIDPSGPGAVTRLVSTTSTRLIQDPTGLTFAVAKTAQDLFDPRDGNDQPTSQSVFAAVSQLQAALKNNDTAGISAALGNVTTSQDYLNTQLGFYGSVQNRVASAIDLAKKFEVQGQAQLSAEQDADISSVALQLTQDRTHLDAAMSAQGSQPKTSLFDYLK